jgi:5,10-methylene-tetrahydrofolate dehydrogenase/methenyl tetrahydrofolate cyclohydrolase
MLNNILNGKKLSENILINLKSKISLLEQKPGLGLIIVGSRKDSMTYVKMKKKACENVGINSIIVELSENINQEDLIKEVNKMNDNESINGILVQLPLPNHIDENKVLLTIKAEKDVDGFHPMNVGNLVLNKNDPIIACTPKGCIKILEENNIDIEGKHAVIIGRSNIVGKPLALLLLNKNATVSICHSKTKNIEEITKQADILLVACGKAQFVKKEWIKEGCIIIDVGINFIDDNTRKSGKRLVGDVDYDDVISKVKAITPVPGGVGPMTIAMLLQNTLELYNKK